MATGPRSRSQNTVIKRGEAHGIAIGLQYRKTNAIPKTKPPRFLLSTSLGLNNRKMQEAMSLGLPVVLVGDLMRCRTEPAANDGFTLYFSHGEGPIFSFTPVGVPTTDRREMVDGSGQRWAMSGHHSFELEEIGGNGNRITVSSP